MQMLLTQVVIIVSACLLSGCSKIKPFPEQITHEYVYDVAPNGEAFCFKYKIKTIEPYLIERDPEEILPPAACKGLTGYLLEDRIALGNWLEDLQRTFSNNGRARR